jgi:hypothetical protein
MLKPIIMIGCGGSGQKSVRYVRDAVRRRLMHAGWEGGIPQACQFLGIDTVNTQEDGSIPFLPNNDYVSVSLNFGSFQQLNNAVAAKFGPDINRSAFQDLQGWRPNPNEVTVPLKKGAAQLRAVGRMAGILALQEVVRDRIKFSFSQCAAGGPELTEVSKHLGVNVPPGTPVPDPIVLVIGSMAGGTGAGIMLDVVDLVRRTHLGGAFPSLVAFTPDIFGDVATDLMTANSAAFMSELLSAYWDKEHADSALIPAQVAVNNRGPHSTFLIGRTNIDGLDLDNSKNVYRAVGEALAAVATSSKVQENFDQFITANWPTYAPANAGGYGFESSELPGVLSSFGSATVSIGRDRFRDYLQKLLHRSVVEHLSDGFEAVAVSMLGQTAAESMAGAAKIAELARRNVDRFLLECGLQEGSGSSQQVTQRFVSNEILKTKVGETAQKIRQPFSPGQQMNGATWQQVIFAKSQEVRVQTLQSIESELTREIRAWGSEVLRNVLKTTTEHSATLSMPVVLQMLEMSRSKVLEAAQQVREEAKQSREMAVQREARARGHLGPKSSGNLALTAAPVGETITDVAQVVVLEWSAQVREKLAVSLEAVAHSMLSSVEAGLQQSLSRINSLVTSQDGKPPVIAGWPKNNGVVPTSFAPSPVEFYLEPYETWPAQAGELLSKSLGDKKEGLPLDPVEAARTLIIRGGFSSGGSQSTAPPLVWADGYSTEPEWEAGHPVSIKVFDEMEILSERIDSWLSRPATALNHILSEGLGDYLETIHPKTKTPIPDHQQRLSRFRQMLQSALMQSRPLLEIDVAMNATVHPKPLNYLLNIQGFPFGVGHPARKETEEIIQGFMNTPESVDWAFTSSETESVLLTSFLEYPVNPSVVTSFTKPLHSALQAFGPQPELLRSSFWQWRRARVLENFIPLPDLLRLAAIRGFAVARATGLVTAYTKEKQNKISTESGVYLFPKDLLSEYDTSNVLPALLEAMILTFGDASTKGKSAFDAYRALVELGTGGGSVQGFTVDGLFNNILKDGNYGSATIVDQNRADAIQASTLDERVQKVEAYLTANLQRFDSLDAAPMDTRSWRNINGSVNPVDTMTKEMLKDFRHAYTEVLDAVRKTQSGGSVV